MQGINADLISKWRRTRICHCHMSSRCGILRNEQRSKGKMSKVKAKPVGHFFRWSANRQTRKTPNGSKHFQRSEWQDGRWQEHRSRSLPFREVNELTAGRPAVTSSLGSQGLWGKAQSFYSFRKVLFHTKQNCAFL